jgi:ferredoxin--NADP+ reductase
MTMRHVAVIGAGPSGLFAAAELLKRPDVAVDVYDRLPTPFGLVRYGVAPDHLKIKSVAAALSKVFADPRVRFFGNVAYGDQLSLPDLRSAYDAVLFATGAARSRCLGIPGEDLPGSYAAADLVSWYNALPSAGCGFGAPAAAIAVIGAGNVSLDIARVLLKSGRGLASTDVPDPVLGTLEDNAVTDVHVVVRRGVADVKFSPAELLELGKLDHIEIVVDATELVLDAEASRRYAEDRLVAARVDVFRDWAGRPHGRAAKRLHFLFGWSPVEITGTERVVSVRLLRRDGVAEDLEVDAVVRAIGYLGEAVEGIPFDDDNGVVPHLGGRVAPGVYVAGWIKRGPSGVIGSNKACAIETVTRLLADLDESPHAGASPETVEAVLRRAACQVVDWAGWTKIDTAEISLGRERGRARTKIADLSQLVDLGRRRG